MDRKATLRKNKQSLQDFEYVDFKVEREEWNKYKLSDGAILKTKFVLINVLAEKGFKKKIKETKIKKGIKVGFQLQSTNVVGVEVPAHFIGEPSDRPYSREELESSVVVDDIDFETILETWNIYKLEDGILLKIRNSPIRIRRTNKFDSRGVPIYLIDFTADIKVVQSKK